MPAGSNLNVDAPGVTPYFTVVMDEEGIVSLELSQTALDEGMAEQMRPENVDIDWNGWVRNLPEFDADDGDYHTIVYNGVDGYEILVRKEWLDDSDLAHREPVFIQVYEKETGEALLGEPIELNSANDWNLLVSLPRHYGLDQIHIREVRVGEHAVTHEGETSHVTASFHEYEVTYADPVVIEDGFVYLIDDEESSVSEIDTDCCWFRARTMRYRVIPD